MKLAAILAIACLFGCGGKTSDAGPRVDSGSDAPRETGAPHETSAPSDTGLDDDGGGDAGHDASPAPNACTSRGFVCQPAFCAENDLIEEQDYFCGGSTDYCCGPPEG